jgi:hypothetical protein
VKKRRTALWRAGGTGRRRRLKIVRPQGHGGSSPSPATITIKALAPKPKSLRVTMIPLRRRGWHHPAQGREGRPCAVIGEAHISGTKRYGRCSANLTPATAIYRILSFPRQNRGMDKDADLTDDQLLTVPGGDMPPGWLTTFFTRRAEVSHQRELIEMSLERSGDSARHFIIFPDMDPKERQRREEEERHRAWLAEQERLEYQERTNRLVAQIDEQQRAIGKRRQEIEDNAIRLHDGRRAYVDGDQYRDEQGRVLTGADRDEAAGQHKLHPEASTWADRQNAIDDAEAAKRLKDKVLQDRDSGAGTAAEKTQRLSGYEQEFQQQIEARAAQTVADYSSGDYMADLGGEYQLSTVPAFTRAAIASHETIEQPSGNEGKTEETKKTPQPFGGGALKLG